MESLFFHPQTLSVVYLIAVALVILLLTWRFTRRSCRAPLLLSAGAYLALLHLVAAAGLLTSSLFEGGIAPMTLLTFPTSFMLAGKYFMPGFATFDDLWANYLRLIVVMGGCNAVFIAFCVRLYTGPSQLAGIPRPSRPALPRSR